MDNHNHLPTFERGQKWCPPTRQVESVDFEATEGGERSREVAILHI